MIPEHKLKELQKIGAIYDFPADLTGLFIKKDERACPKLFRFDDPDDIDLLTAHLECWVYQSHKVYSLSATMISAIHPDTNTIKEKHIVDVSYQNFLTDLKTQFSADTKLEAIAQACIAVGGGNA